MCNDLLVVQKVVRATAGYNDMKCEPEAVSVRMRWVLCGKGNKAGPDVRACLVACDVAHHKQSQFCASEATCEDATWRTFANKIRGREGNKFSWTTTQVYFRWASQGFKSAQVPLSITDDVCLRHEGLGHDMGRNISWSLGFTWINRCVCEPMLLLSSNSRHPFGRTRRRSHRHWCTDGLRLLRKTCGKVM